ncbi:MAG: methyl-accepting chemotaxis protein [Gammaproteobacteria bacterium]|nr:methyl-accepting chemotaxis protein [Gammaproteobacteria bacterium]
MKLKVVTQLVSLLIIVFTALSIIVGFWGWRQMDRPYQIYQDFYDFKGIINTDVYIKLEQYLGSGDAGLLQAVDNTLKVLSQRQLTWLSDEDNDKIQAAIAVVGNNVYQVREAGKLAANPEALLSQNERERVGDVSSLLAYVDQSSVSLQIKAAYLGLLTRLGTGLQQLGYLRQRYIQTSDDALRENLVLANTALAELAQQLYALPGLGLIQAPDEYDFDAESVDLGQEAIDSLDSLTRRYLKELSNTQGMQVRIMHSRKSLKGSIDNLALVFGQYAGHIDLIKASITQQVGWWILISVGIIVLLLVLSFVLQKKTLSFLSQLVPFFVSMAQGRFDERIECQDKFYEIEAVKQAGIHLQHYLEDMIGQLEQEAEQILQSGRKVQGVSDQAFHFAQLQNEKTEAVALSVNQLSESFTEVAHNAANASDSAQEANDAVREANDKLERATQKTDQLSSDILLLTDLMRRLEQDSSAIESVLDVIKGVADQTNLLALNAAIEAARAGEQGRGFAVVADEVRHLAQRTAQSTEEIQTIILNLAITAKEATTAVELQSNAAIDCVDHNQQAQTALKPVVTAVETISNYNMGIASATEQQSVTAEEVARSTGEIQQHANEVIQNMRQVQDASDGLNNVSQALNQLVNRLKSA